MRLTFALAAITTLSACASFPPTSERHGDFVIERDRQGTVVAYTTNGTGDKFARVCLESMKACIWAIDRKNGPSCKTVTPFTATMVTTAGPSDLNMVCLRSMDGHGRYGFKDYALVSPLFMSAEKIEFTIPGAFQTSTKLVFGLAKIEDAMTRQDEMFFLRSLSR